MTSNLEAEMIDRDIQEQRRWLVVAGSIDRELTEEECRPGAIIWLPSGVRPHDVQIRYGH